MRMSVIAAATLLLLVANANVDAKPKQQPLKPYTDTEGYLVYAAVLPVTSVYGRSTVGMYLQTETVPQIECIPGKDDSDPKVREAAAHYESTNLKRWRLLPRFRVNGPVELIPEADLRDHYPTTAYLFVAAVGFSKDKSVALVYAGHYCGGLCGMDRFYLAKKEAGRWTAQPFGICGGMS